MLDSPEAFCSTLERELGRTTADWQKWFSPGVTLILEASGTPSGLVAGAHDNDEHDVVNLMAMWLSPALRGSGAAERLVAGVYEWARSEGARCVRLEVIKGNARARRFYERCGFVSTGHETLRVGDGRIELRMERMAL
jgi:ribosomal protein S18 acetylase RimI-like enzyme